MRLFLFIVVVCTVFSCQKSQEETPAVTRYLTREVSYRSDKPNTKNVRQFTYDASDRVAKIELGTIDSSVSNPKFVLDRTLTFAYAGDANVPHTVSSVRTVFPNLTVNFYFRYDDKNMKVKDSTRVSYTNGVTEDIIVNYSSQNNSIASTPIGSQITFRFLDTLDIRGGNISKHTTNVVQSGGNSTGVYTYTYDTKLNPYHVLNIAGSMYFQNANLNIAYNVPKEQHYIGANTNNMLSYSSNGTTGATFMYLYDKYNYPVKKEMYLPNMSGVYEVTYFEYK